MGGSGPEVVTLGECLVSFVAGELGPLTAAAAFRAYPAGAEANVAVGLARLGRRVAFLGRVGDDGLGRRLVRGPARRGRRRRRPDGRPPGADRVDGPRAAGAGFGGGPATPGQRRPDRGSAPTTSGRPRAAGSSTAHAGSTSAGITPALSASCREAVDLAVEAGRTAGMTISLDINLRRRLWTEAEAAAVLGDLAGRVDVVIADEDEAAVISGTPPSAGHEALAGALLALGPGLAVLKLGDRGAFALERGPPSASSSVACRSRPSSIGSGPAMRSAPGSSRRASTASTSRPHWPGPTRAGPPRSPSRAIRPVCPRARSSPASGRAGVPTRSAEIGSARRRPSVAGRGSRA